VLARSLIGVAATAVGVAAALAARRLDAVVVRGRSMAPALLPGDRLLIAPRRGLPRVGDVVIAADPRDRDRELIKRVAAVEAGTVTLLGDNPSGSTDARSFGPLPADGAGWRVVVRYWPPSRIGPVARSISTGSEPAAQALSGSPSRQP